MSVYQFKIIIIAIILPFCILGHAQNYNEYEIKAAYIERFTRFVEWPDSIQIKDTNKPFVIGIIGESQVSTEIEKMYATQKIKNKKVQVIHISKYNTLLKCNVLYITESEYYRIDKILNSIKGVPILTVCDDPKFDNKGVQIILFKHNNRIFFEIDKEAVNRSGLYMNSLLFELSKDINAIEFNL